MNQEDKKYEKTPEECDHPLESWERDELVRGWICNVCGRFVSDRELGSDYKASLAYYLKEEAKEKTKK